MVSSRLSFIPELPDSAETNCPTTELPPLEVSWNVTSVTIVFCSRTQPHRLQMTSPRAPLRSRSSPPHLGQRDIGLLVTPVIATILATDVLHPTLVLRWGWAFENYGAGGTDHQATPQAVSELNGKHVTVVTSGSRHTLAVTETGDLFSWGWNLDAGQLGHGELLREVLAPKFVHNFGILKALTGARVVSVAGGLDHSLALMSNGTLYSFGTGPFGELAKCPFYRFFRRLASRWMFLFTILFQAKWAS